MIYGAKYWNDPDAWYTQTNNPTEEMLRKIFKENKLLISFLESCGGTGSVNCIAVHYNIQARQKKLEIKCPGVYRPQPEEVLTDHFNDPRNYKALKRERENIGPADLPGNRVPQYFPLAVKEVFDFDCIFWWIETHHVLADFFKKGYSIQLCLKTPSHYVAGVAFDSMSSEIIVNDYIGFNRRISDMYNLENFAILYPPPSKE